MKNTWYLSFLSLGISFTDKVCIILRSAYITVSGILSLVRDYLCSNLYYHIKMHRFEKIFPFNNKKTGLSIARICLQHLWICTLFCKLDYRITKHIGFAERSGKYKGSSSFISILHKNVTSYSLWSFLVHLII